VPADTHRQMSYKTVRGALSPVAWYAKSRFSIATSPRRTMMGRAPSRYHDDQTGEVTVTTPFFLMQTLESIFRSGARLRVTWTIIRTQTIGGVTQAPQTFSIMREGRAESWDFPIDRVDDIAWKISFTWAGRGGSQVRVASTRDGTVSATADGVQLSLNDMSSFVQNSLAVSSKSTVRKSASFLTLGQLEALANAPNALVKGLLRGIQQQVSNLNRIVGIANTLRTMPFSIANQIIDTARNTVHLVNQARRDFSTTPPELYSAKSGLSDLTRAATYLGGSMDKGAVVARKSGDVLDRVRKQGFRVPGSSNPTAGGNVLHDDIITVIRVKAGQTPQTLSVKYYGSTAHAVDILRANKLPWHLVQLKPGTILVIPRLTTNQGT